MGQVPAMIHAPPSEDAQTLMLILIAAPYKKRSWSKWTLHACSAVKSKVKTFITQHALNVEWLGEDKFSPSKDFRWDGVADIAYPDFSLHSLPDTGKDILRAICKCGFEMLGLSLGRDGNLLYVMFMPTHFCIPPVPPAGQPFSADFARLQLHHEDSYSLTRGLLSITLHAREELMSQVQRQLVWSEQFEQKPLDADHRLLICQGFGLYQKPGLAKLQYEMSGCNQIMSLLASLGYKFLTSTAVCQGRAPENVCRTMREYVFATDGDTVALADARALRGEIQMQSEELTRIVSQQGSELVHRAEEKEMLHAELAENSRSQRQTASDLASAQVHITSLHAELDEIRSQLKHQAEQLSTTECECNSLHAQCEGLQVDVKKLESHKEVLNQSHALEVAELHTRLANLKSEAQPAKAWPVVKVLDVDTGKHIHIECPGVEEESFDIHSLPNGVHVKFQHGEACDAFDHEFRFDDKKEGHLLLREDEVSYENGVLFLVLMRSKPQRMKLRRFSRPIAETAILMPVPEAVEVSQLPVVQSTLPADQRICQEECRLTPACSEDGQSIATESSHWIRVPESSTLSASADSVEEPYASALPRVALSSPPTNQTKQCFTPRCQLLDASGELVEAATLKSGCTLLSVGIKEAEPVFTTAIVKAVHVLPARERDVCFITMICGADGSAQQHANISLTADHYMLAGRKGEFSWSAIEAKELTVNDHVALSVLGGCEELEEHEAPLVNVSMQTQSCEVVEVELEDPSHAILLAGVNASSELLEGFFTVVFGCPPRPEMRAVWKPQYCTLEVKSGAVDDEAKLAASDPTPLAQREPGKVLRTIRQPHDSNCRAWCRYHFKGTCRNGVLCSRCHHEDHCSEEQMLGGHSRSRKNRRAKQSNS